MSQTKLYVANWKSHKTIDEAVSWVEEFEHVQVNDGNLVVIAPAFPLLSTVAAQIKSLTNVNLGVQTISPYPAGSYTGAVSGRNLTGLGVTHAIVGHSEERRHFDVTSQRVAQQVDQCLINNIVPIVCVEPAYLAEQARAITADQLSSCVVAYEPVSAIGSGENAPVDQVTEVGERIKHVFGDVSILYGGSVNASNVAEYLPVVDGFIIGTASLDVHEFGEIIKVVQQ